MKRILFLVSALLVVSSIGIARAQTVPIGPFCFDFTNYCDGLELSLNMQTNVITGMWINTDCAGTDVPITWGMRMNGPVGYGGYVLAYQPAIPGYNWAFFIDWPLDGTMDMYADTGGGYYMWLQGINYTMSAGPCPFAIEGGDLGPTTLGE